MYPCMSDNFPVPLFHATTVLKAAVKLLLKLLKGNVKSNSASHRPCSSGANNPHRAKH